jgi:hypothetical protein
MDRLCFLRNVVEWRCWASPEFTFCDVERAIRREIQKHNYLAPYELKAAEASRSTEMAILERLEAKYSPATLHTSEETCAYGDIQADSRWP